MSNSTPQLENGYVRFATEWLEEFIRAEYPGSVKEFVLVIARETWGWNETWREIPAPRIAELLGVSIGRVKQLRDHAVSKNLVEWEPGKGHGSSGRYRVQKDYMDWIPQRVSGQWKKRYGEDASGKNVLSGEHVLSGNDVLTASGKDVLSGIRQERAIHLIDKDRHSKDRTDSARPADAPSLELILEPDPPKPPARSKLDPAQVQADIDAARATFPQDLLSGIDAFLDACRAENKTGAIALTRERTETMALADAYAKLGDGPFRYGLDAALRKGAANVNYLKAAAGSYSADAPRRPQANAYDDPQEAARREYAEQHDRLFGGVR